ncbi:glycosyltransferase [Roseovarius aestuariivivens]|uniref:glycosyltransferase n=1 Tax=Roseovarius aestuariivivens TaxID=1888910 RepID=UPI0010810C48|nr:glycosyltransferase [Roseovarius aestuariivivens]
MGISELRQLGAQGQEIFDGPGALDGDLVRRGVLDADSAALARMVQRHCAAPLDRILVSEGVLDRETVLAAQARLNRSRSLSDADLADLAPLDAECDPRILIKHAVLPVRDRDGKPALVCGALSELAAARSRLPEELAQARVLVTDRETVQVRLAALYREELTEAAEARVPENESCRSWGHMPRRRIALISAGLLGVALFAVVFPTLCLSLMVGWAVLTLLVSSGLKLLSFLARTAGGPVVSVTGPAGLKPPLPRVSMLVPLFRETEIAHALIARLTQLTYPKCLLDVVLVLEEEDALTRQTLAQIDLPPWIRVVVVPDGHPRTKPRAMNYALDFCEGEIVGIFDAEDAPEADQITRVARAFQAAPADVVCLQGVLDYYNSRQNWLARCFTIEYAAWFRMMLPGMARLGLAIPLGGTTLYFRRNALEELGGWDAHNVTEDADLGFRLARHGYRTDMVATATFEEANCRPWPWVKQRSRWLKGYMTTYLVHMRRPRLLYRQLGARKFWGFQAHFVSAVSQVLLAPVLWSFWLVFFGLPHPLDAAVPPVVLMGCAGLFLAFEAINMTVNVAAIFGSGHRHLIAWVATMPLYWPLACIAAYKALYELIVNPFFWDKTSHGLSLTHAPPPPRRDGRAAKGPSAHAAKLT